MSLTLNCIRILNGFKHGTTGLINGVRHISTTSRRDTYMSRGTDLEGPQKWLKKNEVVIPPRDQDDYKIRATVNHMRTNIKYSPKKMWYMCCLIRGLSVDEAIKQLSFVPKKGAQILKEVVQEAQEIAVKEHHFEYKSNMFVGSCFTSKGLVVKGIRKHSRRPFGMVSYFHCHLFLTLVEGPPPDHYYNRPKTGYEKLDDYIEGLRTRNIDFSL